jgi:hypothetical protein
MNKFIKKCGTVVEVETFMKGPKLTEGYEWRSQSDFEKIWKEVPKQHDTKGTLFGYCEKEFMSRQYK